MICYEVRESYDEVTKTIPTNFNEKKVTCKTQSFYILLTFLLITITLLIAVSIYCYLRRYHGKHLLQFQNTDNKLNKLYNDKKLKMSNMIEDISIKHRTYYFFNDIINIKDFDSYNIKIDEKSYQIIPIYYIGYVTIKKDLKIYSECKFQSSKWML